MSENLSLSGQGVTLRAFKSYELEDVLAARALFSGDVQPLGPPRREEIKEHIARSGEFEEGRLDLAVETDGRLVGDVVTLTHPLLDLAPGVYQVGIVLYSSETRGRGIGTEAMRLLVDWLFQVQGAHRVQAGTAEANRPMRSVLDRLGFRFEGVSEVIFKKRPERYAMYAVKANDWK
jgi:RimJ/RimL family protein N-acetyltransferase